MELNFENYLTLKWGTIKSAKFSSLAALKLHEEYCNIVESLDPETQHESETVRQKEIVCQLIDLCDGNTIYVYWEGKHVSKDEAKEYVKNYGNDS